MMMTVGIDRTRERDRQIANRVRSPHIASYVTTTRVGHHSCQSSSGSTGQVIIRESSTRRGQMMMRRGSERGRRSTDGVWRIEIMFEMSVFHVAHWLS
jgi:hypothetical protein